MEAGLKLFKKCPLPESNESSSHYEWDALPLSQEGNYQFFGNDKNMIC